MNPVKRLGVFVTLAILAAAWCCPALASPSTHRHFLELHRQTPPAFKTEPARLPAAATHDAAGAEVLGFYPYWVSASPDSLRWDVLTTVAFFTLEIDGFGDLVELNGWPHGALIDAAHANGAQAVVTVCNFSPSELSTLLGDPANRANAVQNIVDQVQAGNADGVNVDFELLPYSMKGAFIDFLAELKTGLEAVLADPHITVDTPAVDWSGAYDFDRIADHCDYLMIMAYDYHYKGGDPGPVAPLYAGGIWESWTGLDYTLDDYEAYMAPYPLGSAIVGLPLYGYDWPATDDSVPGSSLGTATAIMYEDAQARAAGGQYGPVLYDTDSQTPYFLYQSQGWRQHWFDDADSLTLRFAYADDRGAGGIGFWALGYDGNDPDLWDSALVYFGEPDDDDDTADDDDDNDDAADDDDDDSGQICGGAAVLHRLLQDL